MVFEDTVTVQEALAPPSRLVAVIVAVPSLTAVTIPSSTLAMLAFDELQATILLVAFLGSTVAVSLKVSPSVIERVSELRVILDTLMTGSSLGAQENKERMSTRDRLIMESLFMGTVLNSLFKGTHLISSCQTFITFAFKYRSVLAIACECVFAEDSRF